MIYTLSAGGGGTVVDFNRGKNRTAGHEDGRQRGPNPSREEVKSPIKNTHLSFGQGLYNLNYQV